MLESEYQKKLIKKLEARFPGCLILKNDSSYLQGIPDLSIFYGPSYAMLEIKVDEDASVQPNQCYYVEMVNAMSFASFIHPSNEQEVLDALDRALHGIQ